MNMISRSALLSLTIFASPMLAAQPTNAELAARIAGLEARMAQLEGRAGAPHSNAPASRPTSAKSQDLANWRKCVSGMTLAQVKELLGEPNTHNYSNPVNQYEAMDSLVYGDIMSGGPGGSVMLMGGKVYQCLAVNFPG